MLPYSTPSLKTKTYRLLKIVKTLFLNKVPQSSIDIMRKNQETKISKFKGTFSQERCLILVVSCKQASSSDIAATINSVQMQSYDNWVLIVNQWDNKKPISDERIIITKDAKEIWEVLSKQPINSSSFISHIPAGIILNHKALEILNKSTCSATDAIYTDFDIINKDTSKSPVLNPEWNPELFLSVSHFHSPTFFSIRTVLIENKITLKNKDWFNLTNKEKLLILLTNTPSPIIEHVPLLLAEIKYKLLDVSINSDKYLSKYLSQYQALVKPGLVPGTNQIQWPTPHPTPLVSIIVPTRNELQLVKNCIESIYDKTIYKNFEILLVDNNSDDKSAINYFSKLESEGRVKLLKYSAPFNYSAINNYAVSQAKGTTIVLLNNDVEVISPNWLCEMVANTNRPDIGCVGAMLYYPDDTIQHAGVILGLGRCAGHSHKHYKRGDNGYMNRLKVAQNYSAVTAACLGVQKIIYEQVGGLNEVELTVAFNDVDFCLKVIKAGYRNLWTPHIEMYHHESVSRGIDDTPEKKKRAKSEIEYMQRTWGLDTITDPAYHPYLTIEREDFTI